MAAGIVALCLGLFAYAGTAQAGEMATGVGAVSSNEVGASGVTYSGQFQTATTATATELQVALPMGANVSAASLGSIYGLGAGTFSAGKGTYSQDVYLGISCPSATECVMAGTGGAFYVEQISGTKVTSAVEHAPGALAGDIVSGLSCTSTTSCEVAATDNLVFGTPAAGTLANFDPATGAATVQASTADGMIGVSCATAKLCTAVGYSGAAEYSTNGGSTWSAATSGTAGTLLDVSCEAGSTDCVAVGYVSSFATPVALYSTNNGSSWSAPSALPAGYGLESVSCVGGDCLAGGFGGTMWLSTNNGSSWTAETSGATASLWVALGSAGGNAWAFGPGGAIIVSTDGGTTWASQSAPSSDPFSEATCGPANCVAIDATGALDTNNSGTAWTQMTGSVVPTLDYAVTNPAPVAAGTTVYASANGIANPAIAESGPLIVHDYHSVGGTPGYMVDAGVSSNIVYTANATAATVVVPESLTFTNDTPAFTLLPIPGAGAVSHTVSLGVETNAGAGYSVSAWSGSLKAGAYTLAQGSASGSSSLAVDTFAAQAALTTGGTDGAALQGAYATAGNFVGYGTTSPGAAIVASTGPTGNIADQVSLVDATSVDYAQPAGAYTGTITYVATPNY